MISDKSQLAAAGLHALMEDTKHLREFAPAVPTITQRALMFLNSPPAVAATDRLRQVGAGTAALVGSTAAALLGQERADEIGEKLFGVPEEDKSLPGDYPIQLPSKRPIDDPSRRGDKVRPGTFVDTFGQRAAAAARGLPAGMRYTGPNSASGRSATHSLDTDVGGLSYEDRLRKAKFQQKQYQAQQARQRDKNRRRTREVTIGLAVSLAALLAVGFTVAQVSGVVQKIRRNMRMSKASQDIVKLASMGDIDGAKMLMDKEFQKASGVDVNALADATEGLSEKELKIAAEILKRELR